MARVKRNVQDNYNTAFAKRLRELIESTGVSQSELANSVGVTRQAINSYTLGNTVPNSDVLTNIATYFDVSADYLLGLSNVQSIDPKIVSVHQVTGLSEKAIRMLKNYNKTRMLTFTNMLNFLIEETGYEIQDNGSYPIYEETLLRRLCEYFMFNKPTSNKKYLVTSTGDIIDSTKFDEDELKVFICENYGTTNLNKEIYFREMTASDFIESFDFRKLTEQLKESKTKYIKQKEELSGNHRKEE